MICFDENYCDAHKRAPANGLARMLSVGHVKDLRKVSHIAIVVETVQLEFSNTYARKRSRRIFAAPAPLYWGGMLEHRWSARFCFPAVPT